MIGSSVKNNLKTVLRDPTTLLAILAALILEFMYGINMGYQDMYGNELGKEFYLTEGAYERILNTMMNLVSNPIANIVFVFMGVVLAINLFKDIRLQTYDIVAASGMSFRKYYLSKIVSYYLLALMLSFGLTMLHEILFVIFCLPANPNCDMGKVVIANFVMMIALYTSALWHSFTYAIFLSALTGIPLIGVLFNAVYRYLPYMFSFLGFSTAYYWYFHTTPMVMLWYFKYWITYPSEKWFSNHLLCGNSVTNGFWADIYEVGISWGLLILSSVIMLTLSYFLLKRRFQRS